MKKIGAAIAAIVALALGSIAIYSQTISSESVPADDEITLHIQLDTEEDVGLLIYDFIAQTVTNTAAVYPMQIDHCSSAMKNSSWYGISRH